MIIKKDFDLIYKKSGKIQNIVDISESTLKAYQFSKEESLYIRNLISVTLRTKKYAFGDFVYKDLDRVIFINLPLYPLPGFLTASGMGVVNTHPLSGRDVVDYSTADVLCATTYTVALRRYVRKKPFNKDNINSISDMFFSIFMKFFGKKSGLIGSYKHLIPYLRFLINVYVSVGMIGLEQNTKLYDRVSSEYLMDYSELDLDYDFSSIVGLLRCINKNNILSISENTFSTDVINRIGISALPMFEDVSRFFSTILACSVVGNAIFSGQLKKINISLFDRLLYIAYKSL